MMKPGWGNSMAAAIFLLALLSAFFLVLPGDDEPLENELGVDEGEEPDETGILRRNMVESQLKPRGISDERVLDAMNTVPRHLFMPHSRHLAYRDHPVPIGYGQTISQPYIVALMIQELNLTGDEVVLEVGAGSGYNAAVLAEVAGEVHTIEIIGELAGWAAKALGQAGYDNVRVIHADGYYGIEGMSFDAIILTAAANHVPPPLIEQLRPGGNLILPLGSPAGFQTLTVITKEPDGLKSRVITGVRFVPMTGRAME
jgi:protein-L-isoaspartate(D-aspartate) O-methyltransferase